MPKPTTLPRWATGGTAQIVEPTEGKKDTGWVPMEKPPAQYENWARKLVYDWLVYLNGLANEAFTWSMKHTFSAGLSSGVAPAAAQDVVRKAELDAETTARGTAITTAVTNHNAVTSPHSATSDASASRLVLRDASGRAQFADPSVAQDAANKRYVDDRFPLTWINLPPAPSWGSSVQYSKDASGVVRLRGSAETLSGSNIIGTLPIGSRPLTSRAFAIVVGYGAAVCRVTSMGAIEIVGGFTTDAAFFFDGVSFVAEQ